jgi:hypothetical protein
MAMRHTRGHVFSNRNEGEHDAAATEKVTNGCLQRLLGRMEIGWIDCAL